MDGTTAASRFRAALAMADMGVRLMRHNLKRRHPSASDDEIDMMLRHWLTSRPADAVGRLRDPSFR